MSRSQDRIPGILCRYQTFTLKFCPTLSKDEAKRIGGLQEIQASMHLRWLSERNYFLQSADPSSGSNAKKVNGPGIYYH
jgi:hypothetical protein